MTKELLVVDNDDDFRTLVDCVFTDEGYKVTLAEGGEEALRLLQGGKLVDAILLDLRMPGMSGEEVLDRLREFSEVPVIIVTADITAKTRKDLLEKISCLLEKPFELDDLVLKIKQYAP